MDDYDLSSHPFLCLLQKSFTATSSSSAIHRSSSSSLPPSSSSTKHPSPSPILTHLSSLYQSIIKGNGILLLPISNLPSKSSALASPLFADTHIILPIRRVGTEKKKSSITNENNNTEKNEGGVIGNNNNSNNNSSSINHSTINNNTNADTNNNHSPPPHHTIDPSPVSSSPSSSDDSDIIGWHTWDNRTAKFYNGSLLVFEGPPHPSPDKLSPLDPHRSVKIIAEELHYTEEFEPFKVLAIETPINTKPVIYSNNSNNNNNSSNNSDSTNGNNNNNNNNNNVAAAKDNQKNSVGGGVVNGQSTKHSSDPHHRSRTLSQAFRPVLDRSLSDHRDFISTLLTPSLATTTIFSSVSIDFFLTEFSLTQLKNVQRSPTDAASFIQTAGIGRTMTVIRSFIEDNYRSLVYPTIALYRDYGAPKEKEKKREALWKELEIAIHCHIISSLFPKLFHGALVKRQSDHDKKLHSAYQKLSHLSPKDIGLQGDDINNLLVGKGGVGIGGKGGILEGAIGELSRLSALLTPIEKLSCLNKCYQNAMQSLKNARSVPINNNNKNNNNHSNNKNISSPSSPPLPPSSPSFVAIDAAPIASIVPASLLAESTDPSLFGDHLSKEENITTSPYSISPSPPPSSASPSLPIPIPQSPLLSISPADIPPPSINILEKSDGTGEKMTRNRSSSTFSTGIIQSSTSPNLSIDSNNPSVNNSNNNVVNHSPSLAISADDWLPLFVFIILHARPSHPFANIDYMKYFSPDNALAPSIHSSLKYQLANFEAACSYIIDKLIPTIQENTNNNNTNNSITSSSTSSTPPLSLPSYSSPLVRSKTSIVANNGVLRSVRPSDDGTPHEKTSPHHGTDNNNGGTISNNATSNHQWNARPFVRASSLNNLPSSSSSSSSVHDLSELDPFGVAKPRLVTLPSPASSIHSIRTHNHITAHTRTNSDIVISSISASSSSTTTAGKSKDQRLTMIGESTTPSSLDSGSSVLSALALDADDSFDQLFASKQSRIANNRTALNSPK